MPPNWKRVPTTIRSKMYTRASELIQQTHYIDMRRCKSNWIVKTLVATKPDLATWTLPRQCKLNVVKALTCLWTYIFYFRRNNSKNKGEEVIPQQVQKRRLEQGSTRVHEIQKEVARTTNSDHLSTKKSMKSIIYKPKESMKVGKKFGFSVCFLKRKQ
ncbi:hypothetical protein EDC96DRAFT_544209 [Choanephora cucurbitarum]|nr:hypothetical protein EDC96DRAFT_544209 [Choanephora cucurbitarum]